MVSVKSRNEMGDIDQVLFHCMQYPQSKLSEESMLQTTFLDEDELTLAWALSIAGVQLRGGYVLEVKEGNRR